MRKGILTALLILAPFGFVAAQAEDEKLTQAELEAAGFDAEEITDILGFASDPETPRPANAVSCFDYYEFGSVQARLTAPVTGTVSGAPITFTGMLVNDNPYPIVDGALYVKVFYVDEAGNGNGPDVVDQFFVKGDIAIPANGSVPVSFSWKVPAYAQTGNYQLATFFTASRKFNLLGLSFTDDVVGNTVSFSVSGEQTGIVKFDKSSVTVDEEPYLFAAFPPRMDAALPVTVAAKVQNTSGAAQSASVAWRVYQWDAQLRENVVQEETAQVTVSAGGSADVSITVRDTNYPVYLVVGTIIWQDTQSVIGARFVRQGVDRTRINFPGVMSFPLIAGQQNTLFSCLHNSGESEVVSDGSLDLVLSDRSGNVIHQYNYDGDVTGDMMGIASQFIPKETYDYFTLSARLFHGDQFVDEANLVYDCEVIDPSLCSSKAERNTGIFTSLQSLIAIALSVIILIAALWMYRRISQRPSPNTTQLPPM